MTPTSTATAPAATPMIAASRPMPNRLKTLRNDSTTPASPTRSTRRAPLGRNFPVDGKRGVYEAINPPADDGARQRLGKRAAPLSARDFCGTGRPGGRDAAVNSFLRP